MKSLKLTPKHKTKLLEMCEILFQNFSPFDLELEPQYDGSQYHIIFRYMKDNMFEIHWFEFCMTHLLEKILNPTPNKPNRAIKEHFQEFFWFTNLYCNGQGGQHPIDYLYNEFKKLNK